jgi:hypothetical protein
MLNILPLLSFSAKSSISSPYLELNHSRRLGTENASLSSDLSCAVSDVLAGRSNAASPLRRGLIFPVDRVLAAVVMFSLPC